MATARDPEVPESLLQHCLFTAGWATREVGAADRALPLLEEALAISLRSTGDLAAAQSRWPASPEPRTPGATTIRRPPPATSKRQFWPT